MRVFFSLLVATGVLVTVGAVLVSVTGVAGYKVSLWWPDDDRVSERTLQVGQSVTEGDLTITLVEAQFSETRSLLTFDTRLASVTEVGGLPPVLLPDVWVEVTGVEPLRPVAVSYQRPKSDTVRHYVQAGPPVDQNKPVTVTIQSVETNVGGQFTVVYGPWTFEATAAALGPDPSGRTIEVGRTVTRAEIEITVHKVTVSSDETLVFYNLTAPGDFLGPPSSPVRMFFKDGSFTPGLPLQTDPGGDLVASFPKLPDEVSEFELRFGPYLWRTGGERKTVVPLPALSSNAARPVDIPLSPPVPIAGESLAINRLSVNSSGFSVGVATQSGVSAKSAMTDEPEVQVRDDLGNSYPPAAAELGFGKDESGEPFFRDAQFSFAGPLNPGATSLELSVSNLAVFKRGPWNFKVKLN